MSEPARQRQTLVRTRTFSRLSARFPRVPEASPGTGPASAANRTLKVRRRPVPSTAASVCLAMEATDLYSIRAHSSDASASSFLGNGRAPELPEPGLSLDRIQPKSRPRRSSSARPDSCGRRPGQADLERKYWPVDRSIGSTALRARPGHLLGRVRSHASWQGPLG